MGIVIGGVLGFMIAQSYDVLYAVIIGVIMGSSVAYAASFVSKPKNKKSDSLDPDN